jgi:hypothetical protein
MAKDRKERMLRENPGLRRPANRHSETVQPGAAIGR